MKEEARLKGPSTEIVFGEDQVDSGKIALQYVELQKNFSGLLEELATLRSSFEEFRAVSAETKAHVCTLVDAQTPHETNHWIFYLCSLLCSFQHVQHVQD